MFKQAGEHLGQRVPRPVLTLVLVGGAITGHVPDIDAMVVGERPRDVVLVLVHREHQHARPRIALEELARGRDAVHAAERDVDDAHVRVLCSHSTESPP